MPRLTCIKPSLQSISTATIAKPDAFGNSRGNNWKTIRKRIMLRDKFLCQCEACQASGFPMQAHEVDHIVPLCEGGKDNPENLRAINRECHKAKTVQESRKGRGY